MTAGILVARQRGPSGSREGERQVGGKRREEKASAFTLRINSADGPSGWNHAPQADKEAKWKPWCKCWLTNCLNLVTKIDQQT